MNNLFMLIVFSHFFCIYWYTFFSVLMLSDSKGIQPVLPQLFSKCYFWDQCNQE